MEKSTVRYSCLPFMIIKNFYHTIKTIKENLIISSEGGFKLQDSCLGAHTSKCKKFNKHNKHHLSTCTTSECK